MTSFYPLPQSYSFCYRISIYVILMVETKGVHPAFGFRTWVSPELDLSKPRSALGQNPEIQVFKYLETGLWYNSIFLEKENGDGKPTIFSSYNDQQSRMKKKNFGLSMILI